MQHLQPVKGFWNGYIFGFIVLGKAEVKMFLFSSGRSCFYGICSSCSLSKVSGNRYTFGFIVLYFILFFPILHNCKIAINVLDLLVIDRAEDNFYIVRKTEAEEIDHVTHLEEPNGHADSPTETIIAFYIPKMILILLW